MMVLRPVMPIVNYMVNYDFIVQNLCENREKPEMMCNGKCYLSKELAKTTDNIPKQDNSKINITLLVDSFVVRDIFSFSQLNIGINETPKQNSYLALFYNFSISSSIFHPPLV
ncbi:hypothetical protein [Chryseobacterium sp. POL2]|uniref:hypothetical protein n=1 Tax=Chryseobacterium sp. POL2 TaxID=2713414 RepID=UPI00293C02AE|nr:hypothetical protein [Chryseobacterium sp. POL2]